MEERKYKEKEMVLVCLKKKRPKSDIVGKGSEEMIERRREFVDERALQWWCLGHRRLKIIVC